MRHAETDFQQNLKAYKPRLDLDNLVFEVNKLYHSLEAATYDTEHNEIIQGLPEIWKDMCTVVNTVFDPSKRLRILDYGSGTGFEAESVVLNFGKQRIEQLVCYDPSVEMLQKAMSRLKGRISNVEYHSDTHFLQGVVEKFDLVITNSVLHHMPDPMSVIRNLLTKMTQDACWMAGHEPSVRYWNNPACAQFYADYLKQRKLRRFFDPASIASFFRRKLLPGSDILSQVAVLAHDKGLFETVPSPRIIRGLVDFHVSTNRNDENDSVGFDFREIQKDLQFEMNLIWHTTYNFIGEIPEIRIRSRQTIARAKSLKERFPDDGANFSCVWQRVF